MNTKNQLGVSLVFVLVGAISAAGQLNAPSPLTGSGTGQNLYDQQLMLDSKKSMGLVGSDIEGSPYVNEEFVEATIRTKRGPLMRLPVRYNAVQDLLEYQQRGVTYETSPSLNIVFVKTPAYDLVVEKLPTKNDALGFFVRLDSGKATLLMRKLITIKAAEAPKALEAQGKPARYIEQRAEFFLKTGDAKPEPVSNVKRLIALLPDHQEDVSKFASQNKISKDQEDLTKLIKYYNGL